MYDYFIWRRTEEAITGLTRNQFIGAILIRGFESLRLRYIFVFSVCSSVCKFLFFFHTMLFHPHAAAHAISTAVLGHDQFSFDFVL